MSDYVTNKSLKEDQLQHVLVRLLEDDVIPSSAPLTSIIRTFQEYENQPDKEFVSKVYNLELGKTVDKPIRRFNFALDYIAVLEDKNEIYFLLDNSKIVCIYEYKQELTAIDVYLALTTYLDTFNIEVFMAKDVEAVENYVGCKVAS